MDVSLKVTDQPQESSFFDLISGDNVLSIPLFQRPYRWGQRNLDWLLEDIEDIRSGVTKSCFMGVIVCVSRGAIPGRPLPWEIVDGQQRLTTLYLLLLAAADVGAQKGEINWATGVIGTYLLVRPLSDNPTNTKLVPSFADRSQFKIIWDGLMAIQEIANHPAIAFNRPRPPAPSGESSGAMLQQYAKMKRRMTKVFEEHGADGLAKIVEIAAASLSVVSISLRDPLVAPKIFERLNNRAELVTVADLVRNEVFSKASDDPGMASHIFTNQWEPFSNQFNGIDKGLEKFLFPYGLVLNRQVSKADLFTKIREHWSSLKTPELIISDMQRFVGCFLALESGKHDISLPSELRKRLDRLHRLGKPSSIYSFVMRLVHEVSTGSVPSDTAVEILDVIESFLFRRAIRGLEPTGLHAVFKGLWGELTEGSDAPGVTAKAVKDQIDARTTVPWPKNSEFLHDIKTQALYKRKVAHYALKEYEDAQEGESPSDDFQIEHICPRTPIEPWISAFGERYSELVDTWANLTPLTGRMNVDAGQESFTIKSEEYSDSIFATTRGIAESFSSWSPTDVEQRTEQIQTWALQRWAYGGG